MRVLALDTSTAAASIALAQDGDVTDEVRFSGQERHSARVFPAIASLLEGQGLSPSDLDGFVVATGPGSFTGLRVGIASVQGLALATGRPCLGLSSLLALAARCRGAGARFLAGLQDAGRGALYGAVYDERLEPVLEPSALPFEELLDRVPPAAAVLGDGVRAYGTLIRARRPDLVLPERSLFLAGTLARLGTPRLRAGEGRPADALRPLYLRAPDIRGAAAR